MYVPEKQYSARYFSFTPGCSCTICSSRLKDVIKHSEGLERGRQITIYKDICFVFENWTINMPPHTHLTPWGSAVAFKLFPDIFQRDGRISQIEEARHKVVGRESLQWERRRAEPTEALSLYKFYSHRGGVLASLTKILFIGVWSSCQINNSVTLDNLVTLFGREEGRFSIQGGTDYLVEVEVINTN